ncbi:hypothetical protein L917_06269 [Phytophthora nicotianae]|uniref:Uncharacterized protein n=1 Tax=Phytophthora nicotianae TaxID=4792 RepID=W2LHA5_PHYNI|nr:hypothetical protein L915_06458 [Phytophthora nicotianae]ETL96084.1 hypothetical protein L917_06269 [Phytophthora nicotianae]
MPTTLELLQAGKEAQDEEEARSPICSVESARSFIADNSPVPTENVTLDMCILRIDGFDKLYRLDLIDRDLEPQFDALVETFEKLDVARRTKFVFQLTIWKNRKSELNLLEYHRGLSYRFEKVHYCIGFCAEIPSEVCRFTSVSG